mgnify:CR=1 FL=1
MTKKIFLTALCALALCPAFAQTSTVEEKVEYSTDKYKVETNRFWNNWFISLGAGGQVYFGDHDKQAKFGDRIAPSLNVSVGKWFTPGVGLRLMYSGLQAKGATQTWGDPNGGSYSTGKGLGDKYSHGYGFLCHSKFDYLNLHADVMFNLCQLIGGYNPKRVYSVIPYVGFGWGHVMSAPHKDEITANFGISNAFRLSDAWDLNLDLNTMVVDDRFSSGEASGNRHFDAMLGLTLGATYKFKQRGWDRSKTIYRYNYGDLESMRQKLNDMSAENERLKQALAAGDKQKAQTIVKKIAAANLVTFRIDKSTLTNEARANLGLLAEIIKSGDPEAKYTITGYADAGTGNQKGNERLSKERAESVYKCLVEEFGVDEKQLRIDYKGGVDNMFYNDPRLSRAVITRGE